MMHWREPKPCSKDASMNVTASTNAAHDAGTPGFGDDAAAGLPRDLPDELGEALFDDAAADEVAAAPADGAAGRGRAATVADDERLAAWIDAIVDHDERALSALYDATVARVYALTLRLVRRSVLAEEVVEDTYFQVWRQAARFDAARGRPMTWLLGMARSRAIDAIRREARFEYTSLDAEDAPEVEDGSAAADDLLDAARCHADLHRALMLLNAQPRQLVALAFLRGMSHEEIAEHTTLPLGTVKSQIRRALITLRETLGEHGARLLLA
jgi:RNA polymerase sigma-70 factor (ECF subfamily)